jgi:hypothetical protein
MITLGSKSYPYWAIAQNFNVPYADVIEYLDRIPFASFSHKEPWQIEVWKAWEQQHPLVQS